MTPNLSSQEHLTAHEHIKVQFHSTTEHKPADEQQHQTLGTTTADSQSLRN